MKLSQIVEACGNRQLQDHQDNRGTCVSQDEAQGTVTILAL